MRRRLLLTTALSVSLALGSGFVTTSSTGAFCRNTWHWTGGYANAWQGSDFAAGAIRNASTAAIKGWNGIANTSWHINYVAPGPLGPPSNGGWVSMGTFGAPSFNGAPGITKSTVFTGTTNLAATNTWLDPGWNWNTTGVMNQAQRKVDVKTVNLHEMGHWQRLLHPSDCAGGMTAAEVAAVMNPNWTKKWSTNSDDQDATRAQY